MTLLRYRGRALGNAVMTISHISHDFTVIQGTSFWQYSACYAGLEHNLITLNNVAQVQVWSRRYQLFVLQREADCAHQAVVLQEVCVARQIHAHAQPFPIPLSLCDR